MHSHRPIQQLFIFYRRFQAIRLYRKITFRTDKVNLCQELIRLKNFRNRRAEYIWKLGEDTDNLASFVPFEFADTVIGFYDFGGFYKYSLSTGGFVMYDSFDFPFQSRGDGDYQTTVTHSGSHVFIYISFWLCTAQNAVQRAWNTSHCAGKLTANAG